jgi:two-component system CheB/CheR fusion protein
MAIKHGTLVVTEPTEPRGLRLPIDIFFRSLAEDQGSNAIGVILSGTGTDGTMGLKAIGPVGWFAQNRRRRNHGVPKRHRTGLVDYVLALKRSGRLVNMRLVPSPAQRHCHRPVDVPETRKRYSRSCAQTGRDFSALKKARLPAHRSAHELAAN